ncbi:hypothetical protein [Streptomyces scopuliridis]|uniref:hypothetical protein n=1 Tax=Streptomyces scopuliridis TaxID=452529 RepID=UPI0036B62236
MRDLLAVEGAAGLGLLGLPRGDGEQLRDGWHEPAGRVGVLDELAQGRVELCCVDVVGGEVVLDLLEGRLGDPAEARTRSICVRGAAVTGGGRGGWRGRW